MSTSTRKTPDVLVVGGGAAGLAAALFARRAGASVLLLERNEKTGKKIYITGKGRCNVTNACDTQAFLREVPRNPRFLYAALARLSPGDLMALLESLGCPVAVERGQRVFPRSGKASDVTRAFTGALLREGVDIQYNARAVSLLAEAGGACGVALEGGGQARARRIILCTGGKSYPATGSTGDGYRLAREAGHTLIPPAAVLSALETAEEWPARLMGLSLKNVRLSVEAGGKTRFCEQGEMLFTHFGVSGPLALTASSHLPETPRGALLCIDLKPALTPEQVDARLQRELAAAPRKTLENLLCALEPARLAALLPALCGIAPGQTAAQLSRENRARIVRTLKRLPLTVRAPRPLEEAIVTRGGVDVREVSPRTLESKRCAGLYLAGELLDVDAHTGGFNLHIAFATGALAGESAARSLIP